MVNLTLNLKVEGWYMCPLRFERIFFLLKVYVLSLKFVTFCVSLDMLLLLIFIFRVSIVIDLVLDLPSTRYFFFSCFSLFVIFIDWVFPFSVSLNCATSLCSSAILDCIHLFNSGTVGLWLPSWFGTSNFSPNYIWQLFWLLPRVSSWSTKDLLDSVPPLSAISVIAFLLIRHLVLFLGMFGRSCTASFSTSWLFFVRASSRCSLRIWLSSIDSGVILADRLRRCFWRFFIVWFYCRFVFGGLYVVSQYWEKEPSDFKMI